MIYLLIHSFSGYLSLGYSTPFLSLGSSYMYPSLAAAKAAVVSVGEEIATTGLPSSISPLVFIFTGSGNGITNCSFDVLLCLFVHNVNLVLGSSFFPVIESYQGL